MPPEVPTEFITCPGANPHPGNAALRRAGPVQKIDYPEGSDESFVVLDHECVSTALSDPRLSKQISNAPAWFRDAVMGNSPILAHTMLTADPPEHARLRAPIGKALMPRRIEPLRPRIQEIADDLIDAFPDSGEVDLMSAFAYALPVMVICEFIGIPARDRATFRDWGQVLSQSPGHLADASLRRSVNDKVVTYLEELLAIRREDGRDDVITDLVRAADDGALRHDELVSTIMFVMIAGHKTTSNLIGNGMYLLLTHPGQLELLRSDPGLLPTAIEEFLRYECPVDRATFRVATQDIHLGHTDIPARSFVHLSFTAANHDPAVFTDPDRLDITRTPNRHLSFGPGTHFCAGSALARMEGQIAFSALLRRLPDLELAVPAQDLTWLADTSVSRGLEALPLRIKERLPRTAR
jgi:cytochrome P450